MVSIRNVTSFYYYFFLVAWALYVYQAHRASGSLAMASCRNRQALGSRRDSSLP